MLGNEILITDKNDGEKYENKTQDVQKKQKTEYS